MDTRPDGLTARRVLALFFLATVASAMHWLIALLVVLVGCAFYLTTRRGRICPNCGHDAHEDSRRGFRLTP